MSGELVVVLTDAQLKALAKQVAAEVANGNGNSRHEEEPDVLLDAKAAAARLGVSVRWVYGHASTLPFTVRLPHSRAVRYSARGIARWIAKRQRGA